MKKLIILTILLFALPCWVWGANCGGATPCACGDTVTSSYTLSADLVCTNAGDALTIGGDDITLDLGGYTISGDGTNVLHGVTATDRSNITITNGTVTNMDDHLIDIAGGSNIVISNLILHTVSGEGGWGGNDAIFIGPGASGPATVSITGNTIGLKDTADNIARQGIAVVVGSSISITNNVIYGGRIGIDIEPNAGNVVDGVTISGNIIDTYANTNAHGGWEGHSGIELNESAGTIQGTVSVTNNTVDLNDQVFGGIGYGIAFRSLEHGTFTVKDNIFNNVKTGAALSGPIVGAITLTGNRFTGGATNHSLGVTMGGADASIANVDILSNFIFGFEYGIDFNTTGTGTAEADVLNNTIDCGNQPVGWNFGLRVTNLAHDATVTNNIFFGTPTGYYINLSGANPAFAANYNCYESSGNYWKFQGGAAENFAAWQVDGEDANGINADPDFVDSANDDYHLLVSSPCIDAGSDQTATVLTDIDGQDADHANMDGDADGSSLDMDIGADQVMFKLVIVGE